MWFIPVLRRYLCTALLVGLPTQAQVLSREVASAPKILAVSGEPFGVCAIQWKSSENSEDTDGDAPIDSRRLSYFESSRMGFLFDSTDRILYPAWIAPGTNPLGPIASTAPSQTVSYFLFKGEKTLELNFGMAGTVRVDVSRDDARHKELLKKWWNLYSAQTEWVVSLDCYEPLVETYLTSMLARRMNVQSSRLNYWRPWKKESVDDVVGLLLGTESIRLAMQRHTILDSRNREEKADQPMPKAVTPPEVPIPPFDESKVSVEPIAMRVPKECFYLRSGSFSNFLWLRRMLDEWGGEFRNLVATRGADYRIRNRLERQLALRETELSRRFGGLVVGDVAVIGTDTFFREGSAVGILFKAKSNHLLAKHLLNLRKQCQSEDNTITESRVKLGDGEASLLSRADNAVRSFYVADRDYHLVTNSRWIAERFMDTAKHPDQALGSLKDFHFARSRVSSSRNDTGFLYLSDPFFRNLVGPAYRVEMTRRALSLAELSVLPLAQLAAKAEGPKAVDLASLIQGGFLPPDFGHRVDGSGLELRDEHFVDTLRGGRGSFLPVPDVAIAGITPSEADAYQKFARNYTRLWTNMDPVFGSIIRTPLSGDREKVALELHISPYAKSRYGPFEAFLASAGTWRLAPVRGNLLSLELVMQEGRRTRREDDAASAPKTGPKDANRLFGGLREWALPFQIKEGDVVIDRSWKRNFETGLLGYIGQYMPAKGGVTDFLFKSQGSRPDAKGYVKKESLLGEDNEDDEATSTSASKSGVWSRTFGDFMVMGIDRNTLELVTPQLKLQKAERAAQLRLELGDLGTSRFRNFLTAELYARDRRTSAGNALLLHTLSQQLHIDPKDALKTAEELLDQRITCPLGGTYVLSGSKPERWISTAWTETSLKQVDRVPSGYRYPGLEWLHRMALEFSIDPQALQTRIELDVSPAKRPSSETHQNK